MDNYQFVSHVTYQDNADPHSPGPIWFGNFNGLLTS